MGRLDDLLDELHEPRREKGPARVYGRQVPIWRPTTPQGHWREERSHPIEFQTRTDSLDLKLTTHFAERREEPELATGEKFRSGSSLADDLYVVKKLSRSRRRNIIADLNHEDFGDERRWRNRADVMASEFLEMIRPKYGSIIPDFIMTSCQGGGRELGREDAPGDHVSDTAENCLAKCSAFLGEGKQGNDPVTRSTDFGAAKTTVGSFQDIERSIKAIETQLSTPSYTQYSSLYDSRSTERNPEMYPESNSELACFGLLRPRKANESSHSQYDAENETPMDNYLDVGSERLQLSKDLVAALRRFAPIGKSRGRIRSQALDGAGGRPIDLNAEALARACKETSDDLLPQRFVQVNKVPLDSDIGLVLSRSEYGIYQSRIDVKGTGYDWLGLFQSPLIRFEKSLSTTDAEESPILSWNAFKLAGVNTGNLRDAAVEEETDFLRKRWEDEQREIMAKKKKEEEKRFAAEQEKVEEYKQFLMSEGPVPASTEAASAEGQLGDRKDSEIALQSQWQQHQASIAKWNEENVINLVKAEIQLAKNKGSGRIMMKYLRSKAELPLWLSEPLDWSDTEDERDEVERVRPVFTYATVYDNLLTKKKDALRVKVDRFERQFARVPDDYAPKPSAAGVTLTDLLRILRLKPLMAGWIRQYTIESRHGFAWAHLAENFLVVLEASRTDVSKTNGSFILSSNPAQRLTEMNVLGIYWLNDNRPHPYKKGPHASHLKLARSGSSLITKLGLYSKTASVSLQSASSLVVQGTDLLLSALFSPKSVNSSEISLTFTAARDVTLSKWSEALRFSWLYGRHSYRMRKQGRGPYHSLTLSLTDPVLPRLDLSREVVSVEEAVALLQDIVSANIEFPAFDISRSGIDEDWLKSFIQILNGCLESKKCPDIWNLRMNRFGADAIPLCDLIDATGGSVYIYEGCNIRDSHQFGERLAAILSKNASRLKIVDLRENFLGTGFAAGLCEGLRKESFSRDIRRVNTDVEGEEEDLEAVTLILRENSFNDSDGILIAETIANDALWISHLDICNCTGMNLKVLQKLISSNVHLMLPGELRKEIDEEKEEGLLKGSEVEELEATLLEQKIASFMKANQLKDTMKQFESIRRQGALFCLQIHFPAGLASTVFASAGLSTNSRRLILESCKGDCCLVNDSVMSQEHGRMSLRSINLIACDWLSDETEETIQGQNFIRTAGVKTDPRFYMLILATRLTTSAELQLSHCGIGRIGNVSQAGSFLADIIMEQCLQYLDLTACGIADVHLLACVRILEAKLKERLRNQKLALPAPGQVLVLKKNRGKTHLTGYYGNQSAADGLLTNLRRVNLNLNPITVKGLLVWLREIIPRAPMLTEIIVPDLPPEEFKKMKRDAAQMIAGWKDSILVVKGLKSGMKHAEAEAGLFEFMSETVVVTPEEVQRALPLAASEWEVREKRLREEMEQTRLTLRENRIDAFFSRRKSPVHSWIDPPKSMADFRRTVLGILERRFTRIMSPALVEGVFPPFHIAQLVMEQMEASALGGMEKEQEILLGSSNHLELVDFSGCPFRSKVFSDFIADVHDQFQEKRKVTGALDVQRMEPHLGGLILVNMSLDSTALLDMTATISATPVTASRLDLSVNRLNIPTAEHLAALQTFVSILEPRHFVLDANWLGDGPLVGEFLSTLVLKSKIQNLSIRKNQLGKVACDRLSELIARGGMSIPAPGSSSRDVQNAPGLRTVARGGGSSSAQFEPTADHGNAEEESFFENSTSESSSPIVEKSARRNTGEDLEPSTASIVTRKYRRRDSERSPTQLTVIDLRENPIPLVSYVRLLKVLAAARLGVKELWVDEQIGQQLQAALDVPSSPVKVRFQDLPTFSGCFEPLPIRK